MPRYNGTGPLGFGPGTGWGLGPCGAGMGWRRGFSRGLGGGFGWKRFGNYPLDSSYQTPITRKKEAEILKEETEVLEEELNAIKTRLNELEGQK